MEFLKFLKFLKFLRFLKFLKFLKFLRSHQSPVPQFQQKPQSVVRDILLLEPKLCILDETDSGLDIDALRVVAEGVNAMRSPDRAMLVITHYQRLLDYIVPDRVHVLSDGQIVRSGSRELAGELEDKGYSWIGSPE